MATGSVPPSQELPESKLTRRRMAQLQDLLHVIDRVGVFAVRLAGSFDAVIFGDSVVQPLADEEQRLHVGEVVAEHGLRDPLPT